MRVTLLLALVLAFCLPCVCRQWADLVVAQVAQAVPPSEEKAEDADYDVRMGKRYINAYCSRCHGRDGKGARGPDLTQGRFRRAQTDEELLNIIQAGIPGTDMVGIGPDYPDICLNIIAYLRAEALNSKNVQIPPAGSVTQGYELFKQHKCASCHWVQGGGGRLGTDLSRLTAPPDYVRNSMLDPESQIDQNFQNVIVYTQDDLVLHGRRLHENSYFLLMMDMQENLHVIAKQHIQEIKRPHQSLMPSFRNQLNGQDIEDITTYIFSLQKNQLP